MRLFNWLWRAALFFVLFAFALNNQHVVEVRWFFGHQWRASMIYVVLIVFVLGCATGVLAMLPSWWRHRRGARRRELLLPEPVAASPGVTGTEAPGSEGADAQAVPSVLPFPPDMPAPRTPPR
ncbi:MAG: lipopolysaccharide assembly LapA domain-containing protein [Aquabacterium sp.]|jgi:uncharacterized integral membrane protein